MGPLTVLAASPDRQALVPMTAGYLALMSALALGLRRQYRPRDGGQPDRPPSAGQRSGWEALARRLISTVVGGYLLLLAGVIGYYYGVARVGPGFVQSAITGTALLIGLAAPVFAAASWLTLRPRRRRPAAGGPRDRKPGRPARTAERDGDRSVAEGELHDLHGDQDRRHG